MEHHRTSAPANEKAHQQLEHASYPSRGGKACPDVQIVKLPVSISLTPPSAPLRGQEREKGPSGYSPSFLSVVCLSAPSLCSSYCTTTLPMRNDLHQCETGHPPPQPSLMDDLVPVRTAAGGDGAVPRLHEVRMPRPAKRLAAISRR